MQRMPAPAVQMNIGNHSMHGLAAFVLTLVHFMAVAQEDNRDAIAFDAWRQAYSAEVAAFSGHLAAFEVGSVVPLHELLRSASSWSSCKAEPFAVPRPSSGHRSCPYSDWFRN